MGFTGAYTINTVDLYTTFGFVVTSGSDDILAMYKRKESLSHDWDDENGIDIDLSTPRFKNKEIKLKGYIKASSDTDFWNKHKGLFALLSTPGVLTLSSSELSLTVSVYYSDCTDLKRQTRLKGVSEAFCEYTLLFIEPIPGFWI